MVVDDLDLFGTFPPYKAYSPPIVDPNRVLTGTVALEGFEPVARRLAQVAQDRRGAQHIELPTGNLGDAPKLPWRPAFEKRSGRLVSKPFDHTQNIFRFAYNCKRSGTGLKRGC
jgi:hypothetical protein